MWLPIGSQKADEIGKKILLKRTAIEPNIGHLKRDHHLSLNMLHGVVGDGINAIWPTAAYNPKNFVCLAYEKLTAVISALFGKPLRRPKCKTKALPLYKPRQTVGIFPKCAVTTRLSPCKVLSQQILSN
jgi:hypothetical protein